jgi:hypothetical protein
MISTARTAPPTKPIGAGESAYVAGSCNIGPDEIARRRWTGHVGTLVTLAGLGIVAVSEPPALARLALFLPASVAAAGYIQAASRFCADYGWRGVFNFGEAGHDRVRSVADEEARRADRRTAIRIGVASGAVGLAVAVVALFA